MKLSVLFVVFLSSFAAFAQAPDLSKMPQVPSEVNKSVNDATKSAPQPSSMMKQVSDKAVVHINSASLQDLAKLPGIGPAKAKAIVDGRPYKSIEDLKNVKGIKEAVFAKIKGMIAL